MSGCCNAFGGVSYFCQGNKATDVTFKYFCRRIANLSFDDHLDMSGLNVDVNQRRVQVLVAGNLQEEHVLIFFICQLKIHP